MNLRAAVSRLSYGILTFFWSWKCLACSFVIVMASSEYMDQRQKERHVKMRVWKPFLNDSTSGCWQKSTELSTTGAYMHSSISILWYLILLYISEGNALLIPLHLAAIVWAGQHGKNQISKYFLPNTLLSISQWCCGIDYWCIHKMLTHYF